MTFVFNKISSLSIHSSCALKSRLAMLPQRGDSTDDDGYRYRSFFTAIFKWALSECQDVAVV